MRPTGLAKRFGDPVLVGTVVLLTIFGIFMIWSAGQAEFVDKAAHAWRVQIIGFALSLVTFWFLIRIPLRWYEWAAQPAYILAIALLVAVLIFGTGAETAKSSTSWLKIGHYYKVQPSEFAKYAVVMMLARQLSSWRTAPEAIRDVWSPLLIVALPLLLVLAQPDLGTALVFVALAFGMLFWAGTPPTLLFLLVSPIIGLLLSFSSLLWAIWFVALIAFLYFSRVERSEWIGVIGANMVAGTVAVPIWDSMQQYQRQRLLTYIDPSIDPLGARWHVNQSKIAIGSGGLVGKGFGMGTQKRLGFLPERHTDFIFSVIGEEWGFMGTAVVIMVFALILHRVVRIADRSSDGFGSLVTFGVGSVWFAHVLENIGMTVGAMPTTGIPLVFVSYGNSALLASFIGLALVARTARESR